MEECGHPAIHAIVSIPKICPSRCSISFSFIFPRQLPSFANIKCFNPFLLAHFCVNSAGQSAFLRLLLPLFVYNFDIRVPICEIVPISPRLFITSAAFNQRQPAIQHWSFIHLAFLLACQPNNMNNHHSQHIIAKHTFLVAAAAAAFSRPIAVCVCPSASSSLGAVRRFDFACLLVFALFRFPFSTFQFSAKNGFGLSAAVVAADLAR